MPVPFRQKGIVLLFSICSGSPMNTIKIVTVLLIIAGSSGYSADWYALSEHAWHGNSDHGPSIKLKEIYGQKNSAKCVAFTADNDWVVLFGENGVWTSNLKVPAIEKLVSLMSGHTLKCIAFTPKGGGAVLFDKNGYWAQHIPEPAFAKLGEIANAGGSLRSISFSPGGGWVVLFDDHGICYDGLSAELSQILNRAVANGNPVRCVSFTNTGDWFVISEKGWWTSNLKHPAAVEIAKLEQSGEKINWVAVAPEDPPLDHCYLEIKPSRQIKATLATEIAHPDAQVDEWIIYAPHVPNVPSQQNCKTSFEPAGETIHEASPLKQPLTLLDYKDGRQQVKTLLTIETTLQSRHLRALAPNERPPVLPDLTAEQVALFTRASSTTNFNDKAFRDWEQDAGLHRKPNERDIDFAFRAFSYIKHHFTYQWPTPANNAVKVCTSGKSDCGGLSTLFTATMRANGVPARLLGGRWASSQKPGEKTGDYGQWHVKAEFFARDIGWIPVDSSGAVSDTNGRDRAYFGNDNGDHIAMAIDQDLQVNSLVSGMQTIGVIQGLLYWWRGRGPDKEAKYDELWTVETVTGK